MFANSVSQIPGFKPSPPDGERLMRRLLVVLLAALVIAPSAAGEWWIIGSPISVRASEASALLAAALDEGRTVEASLKQVRVLKTGDPQHQDG